MKIKDLLLLESASYIKTLKSFAKGHYPDAESDEEALLQLFARSLSHAKDDDNRQDNEIRELKDRLVQIEEILKKLSI